jgi:glycosyltransferase involved in cell wall biosynthesis
MVSKSRKSIVVSQIDADYIGLEKVEVIPLGIDEDFFRGFKKNFIFPIIIFTGNMNYHPNIISISWFISLCWPGILSRVPNAELRVVGAHPTRKLLDLASTSRRVKILGRVPSIADELSVATVAIAPMQSGSGMQFKILEAMACNVPVVSTTLGLGDIDALPNEDVLLADSAADFSDQVIKLLMNEDLAKNIADNARKLVSARHRWDNVNEAFSKNLIHRTIK